LLQGGTSLEKVEIRRPKTDELEQIHQFFSAVITDTYLKEGLSDLNDELLEEIESKKKFLADDISGNGEKNYFLFAYLENKIIGTIAYGQPNSLIVEESKGQLDHLHEVGSMLVHPDYQNKGIGNQLLQAIFDSLRVKGIKEFCFDSGYKQAQMIWTKKFGAPLIYLENYWGEDSPHMIWRIKLSDV